jgi:hypothetical protein
MQRIRGIALAVITLFGSTLGVTPQAGITLVGTGLVPGDGDPHDKYDKSGLKGLICEAGNPTNCIRQDLFGGFGSGLTYTGHDNVFIAASDRGPFDGLTDVPYLDRVHFLKITTNPDTKNISTVLLDTRLLRNESGQFFVGAAGSFVKNDELATLRFDPEGIRVGLLGTLFISDEYGPDIFQFGPFGRLLRRLNVPSKFKISEPSADEDTELLSNKSGRQANRGMEGLAISPNGRFLFGIMQNALLQDNGLRPGTTNRVSRNNRILKIDLLTGRTHEYVYVLDAINQGKGVCEILAINDHEFLVLERDNNYSLPPGSDDPPELKAIYKIDINGATDVSEIESLPACALSDPTCALTANIVPVKKTPFIDLLGSAFGLVEMMPEKIEGLAWGPDLPDGRHLLYVVSDNDLNPALGTQIYAFAIDPSLINLEKQILLIPLYPPWLIPKD